MQLSTTMRKKKRKKKKRLITHSWEKCWTDWWSDTDRWTNRQTNNCHFIKPFVGRGSNKTKNTKAFKMTTKIQATDYWLNLLAQTLSVTVCDAIILQQIISWNSHNRILATYIQFPIERCSFTVVSMPSKEF